MTESRAGFRTHVRGWQFTDQVAIGLDIPLDRELRGSKPSGSCSANGMRHIVSLLNTLSRLADVAYCMRPKTALRERVTCIVLNAARSTRYNSASDG